MAIKLKDSEHYLFRRTVQGAWEVTALVTDKETPFPYYEHAQFFGYSKLEAALGFTERLKHKGQTPIEQDRS